MFHPREFEDIAFEILKRIVNKSLDDAKSRTAISRVYYSCFLTAREKLKSILSPKARKILLTGKHNNKRVNVHYLVIETFIRSKDKNHKRIGDELDKLREKRNKSDYDLNYRVIKPELEAIKAKQLRKDIETVKNEALLSKAFAEVIEELNG